MTNVNKERDPYHKFKGWMVENQISQQELADLLHLSRTNLNKRLNGSGADFSLDELRKIKEVYQINTDEFFL